jgi:CheY-like chemotaxis protein
LNELLALFGPEAKLKSLSLISIPTLSENDCTIITDNHKLYGILSNLIKNAVKFTQKGNIKMGYDLKDNMLEFYVRDTGIGVPKDRQEAIFNRFEQADNEDTRVYEGSGLGLPIAKSYAKMLGGTMWMTSREGDGSEFKFTVPYKTILSAQKNNSPKTEVVLQQNNINQLRVLIAEDDETNKQYFEVAFRNKFHEIIFAETGQQTIDTCRNKPVDLILMDIKMPGMSGYAATREIRKFNKEVIIIAQTAYATVGDKKKALDVGCDDYITKPINIETLLELIKYHVQNKNSI